MFGTELFYKATNGHSTKPTEEMKRQKASLFWEETGNEVVGCGQILALCQIGNPLLYRYIIITSVTHKFGSVSPSDIKPYYLHQFYDTLNKMYITTALLTSILTFPPIHTLSHHQLHIFLHAHTLTHIYIITTSVTYMFCCTMLSSIHAIYNCMKCSEQKWVVVTPKVSVHVSCLLWNSLCSSYYHDFTSCLPCLVIGVWHFKILGLICWFFFWFFFFVHTDYFETYFLLTTVIS